MSYNEITVMEEICKGEHMDKKTAFLYSGQGSQYLHMGQSLYESNETFRDSMDYLNQYVIKTRGYSVLDYIYQKKQQDKNDARNILYSHPSIFMVEYSLSTALLAEGIQPDYLIGQSMGEIVSMAISGVLAPIDSLEYILEQAEFLNLDIDKQNGMMAVLCDLEEFSRIEEMYPMIELAGINCKKHFVVAGPKIILKELYRQLRKKRILGMILPVDYAFHSSHVDCLSKRIHKNAEQMEFKEGTIPCVSCVDGKIRTIFEPSHIYSIARCQIRFDLAIDETERIGPMRYIDLSPSGTMASFLNLRKLEPSDSEVYHVLNLSNKSSNNFNQVVKMFHELEVE